MEVCEGPFSSTVNILAGLASARMKTSSTNVTRSLPDIPSCVAGGGGYSLIWPVWGCAAGQGTAFELSVLNGVYNFARVQVRIHTGFHRFTEIAQSFHNNKYIFKSRLSLIVRVNVVLNGTVVVDSD